MNNTDQVERHWEWIKYTLLQDKVNCSLRNLIVAINESAADGSVFGGAYLVGSLSTSSTHK
jgi:hypothetical protein